MPSTTASQRFRDRKLALRRRLASWFVSDRAYVTRHYRNAFGCAPDLEHPSGFNEKILVKILRDRDLIDPMTGTKEWTTLSTTDDPDTTSSDGNNVFEVHSKSTALALDGKTRYNEW